MRILHAIHDFLPRHQAGSEIYAFNLAQAQRGLGMHVHVLCAEYDPGLPHGSFRWRIFEGLPVTELINNWAFERFLDTYQSPLLGRQLAHVLRALRPDVLHIHNFLNLTFELPAIARQLGIPTVATLHEYALVCPSGGQRVHRAEEHVCVVVDPARCSRCFAQHGFSSQLKFGRTVLRRRSGSALARLASGLRKRLPRLAGLAELAVRRSPVGGPSVTAADIASRLEAARRVFEQVDLFIAPSPNLATEFQRLGIPAGKLRVRDYGFPPLRTARRSTSQRLRIGFAGTLVWHKGVHILLDAARLLLREDIEILIFGDPNTFPDYVAQLQEQARGLPVRLMGRFERDSVAEVYAQMDVLVVPSLWPENSPLVIHEAFMSGLPVIGSREGGTQDLVTHGVNGLLYEAFSPIALADALRAFLDDRSLVSRFPAAAPPIKSLQDDARELEAMYRELVDGRNSAQEGQPHPEVSVGSSTTAASCTAAVVVNYRTADDTLLALGSLNASSAPVHDIWVVDNGSDDGQLDYLRRGLGQAALIASEQNLGFSGGCNLGIRAALDAGADRVLLMNSDAVLPAESLQEMHAALDAEPILGIVGPTILSRSDPERIISRGIRFSRRTGRMRHAAFRQTLAENPAGQAESVDAVSGCAMLIRREVFDRIGLLDESYFFGFEDLDFCLRARASGFRTGCVQAATLLHAGSASIGSGSPRLIYFGTRNHLLLGSRLAGPRGLRSWCIGVFSAAHVLFSSPVPLRLGVTAFRRGVRDYRRGTFGCDLGSSRVGGPADGGAAVTPETRAR
jgi:GT2 family glycosyltransferase/glycosyltransferase involved in cell wall biosynthesis